MRANFRGLARQEYAEDAESCFLASGDCVFELEAIEAAAGDGAGAGGAAAERGAGDLAAAGARASSTWWRWTRRAAEARATTRLSQVLEMETGLQCAEFAGHVGGLELARLVTELADEYNRRVAGGGAEQSRQRRAGADLETVCRYARIYRAGRAGGMADHVGQPAGGAGHGWMRRWWSSRNASRAGGCWGNAGALCGMPNGRTGARAGTHDDRVMAMAIGLAARAELLVDGRRCEVQAGS